MGISHKIGNENGTNAEDCTEKRGNRNVTSIPAYLQC